MNSNSKISITHTLQVIEANSGLRLDAFITQKLPIYSRSFYQKLIEQGFVTVNGAVVDRASTPLKTGDTVEVSIPKVELPKPKPIVGDLGVRIIFEHPDFLIINKPAGLLVHIPSHESDEVTLVDWLLAQWPYLKDVGELERPGIVHRLDKDTSGIMIIARNNPAHARLSAMFKDREINKTYLAVVQGHPAQSGTIDFPIGRDPHHRYKMMAFKDGHTDDARPAVTHFAVLKYFDTTTLIEAKPVTGRTHQIRVHCAAIGHSIIGDAVYGTSSPLINRQALHANSLHFKYDNQEFSFTATQPADFLKLLSCLNQ